MNVSRIIIQNVLGIEHLEIEPGALTVVEGRNATGKSSVMEAIKTALAGGHDATLLRNGAEAGEVVLVLDDGTEITKKITAGKSATTIRHPKLGKITTPASFLQQITDSLGINPVAFLAAPAKKRTEYLLESLPLSATIEQLQEAAGDSVEVDDRLGSTHALTAIETVRKQAFDIRTGTNRAAKEKRATVNQLFESLPADPQDPDTLAEQISEITDKGTRLRDDLHAELRRYDASRDAEISRLTAERDAELDRIREAYEERITEVRTAHAEVTAKTKSETEPVLQDLRSKMTTMQEQLRQAERNMNTLRVAQKMVDEATTLEDQSQALTDAIDRLDALKADLLSHLPIPEIEIRDGEIYSNGVPFDRLNTAMRVSIAMKLAEHRSGKLGLICVDGLECLDPDSFDAFRAWASGSNSQFVVTRVTDGDLAVSVSE